MKVAARPETWSADVLRQPDIEVPVSRSGIPNSGYYDCPTKTDDTTVPELLMPDADDPASLG